MVWLLWMAATFNGLPSPDAMDHAQAARNVAVGNGFVTSAISPLSLDLVPNVTRHPVLFHSPLFLAWEAVWFRISQPSDTVAAFASGTMWMLACWMVYLVALRLFTPSIGLFAVLLFLANASLLRFAVSGLPHLMAGFLLTGLLWSLAGPREENDDPLVPPWWSLVASGVFVGLAGLAEQTLVWVILVPVALYWALRPRWAAREYGTRVSPARARRAGLIAVVALLAMVWVCLAPWMLRNHLLVGSLFWTPDRYDVLTHTATFPGQTAYRRLASSLPGPLEFALEHPGEVLRKCVSGALRLSDTAPSLAGWVVLALFLAGCLFPPAGVAGRIQRYLLLMLGLASGVLCLTSQQFDRLVVFLPGLTLFAAAAAYRLLDTVRETGGAERLARRRMVASLVVVWVVAAAPLITARQQARRSVRLLPTRNVIDLAEKMERGSGVITDAPWLVAWYTGRPAVWLPQDEQESRVLLDRTDKLSWMYFTYYRRWLAPNEVARWWMRAVRPPGGFGPFVPQESKAPGEVVLRRKAAQGDRVGAAPRPVVRQPRG